MSIGMNCSYNKLKQNKKYSVILISAVIIPLKMKPPVLSYNISTWSKSKTMVLQYYKAISYILRDWKFCWTSQPKLITHPKVI